ncbi:MAG: DNA repair protein RecO C-terminal domain-containing protein [Oscillospiraceae bacterium]
MRSAARCARRNRSRRCSSCGSCVWPAMSRTCRAARSCGAPEPVEPWLSLRGGAVYCAQCRGASSSAVTPLLPETLAAMRHVVNADPKKIFSFTLGDAGRRQLARVCEEYTAIQLERGFASLDYWKKVKD